MSASVPQQKHSSLECSLQEKPLATEEWPKTIHLMFMGLAHSLMMLTK